MNIEPSSSKSSYTDGRTEGSPGELHDKIEATRHRLDDTFDLLIEQLSPSHLWDSVSSKLGFGGSSNGNGHGISKTKAKEGCRRAYSAISQQVRTHPGPMLLLGAGLVWMMLDDDEEPFAASDDEDYPSALPETAGEFPRSSLDSGSSVGIVPDSSYIGARKRHGFGDGDSDGSDDSSIGDRISDAASGAAERVKSATRSGVRSVKDAARATAESTSEWSSTTARRSKRLTRQVKGRVRESYEAGSRRYDEAMEEHPLAVAAGAIALGLLGALALPRTRQEDEWVGEESDAVKETAKERGHDLAESAKTVAERTREKVKEEAREAGFTAENLKEKGKELASKAGEVAQKVKEEATHAAEEEKEKHKDHLKSDKEELKSTLTPNASSSATTSKPESRSASSTAVS